MTRPVRTTLRYRPAAGWRLHATGDHPTAAGLGWRRTSRSPARNRAGGAREAAQIRLAGNLGGMPLSGPSSLPSVTIRSSTTPLFRSRSEQEQKEEQTRVEQEDQQ